MEIMLYEMNNWLGELQSGSSVHKKVNFATFTQSVTHFFSEKADMRHKVNYKIFAIMHKNMGREPCAEANN
jgi:hypothetical protein